MYIEDYIKAIKLLKKTKVGYCLYHKGAIFRRNLKYSSYWYLTDLTKYSVISRPYLKVPIEVEMLEMLDPEMDFIFKHCPFKIID